MMLRDLYQEVIIDHNRNPRNFGELDAPTRQAEGYNPLCGDKLSLYLDIDDGIISNVRFKGEGCAISTASASLMTETLKGKTLEEAHAIFEKFHTMLTSDDTDSTGHSKLDVLAGVKTFPSRIKCATLAWHTLEAALSEAKDVITTE